MSVPPCLLAAFVSYAVVELPFLRHRERWAIADSAHDELGAR